MRPSPWFPVLLLTLTAVLASCAAEECTIENKDDGSAVLRCPDGTSTVVTSGNDGVPGLDGVDGRDAVATLVRIDEEPPGLNCTEGGLAVHVGQDLDGDGVLSNEEIVTTRYICNGTDGTDGTDGKDGTDGEDGLTTLIDIVDEPPGSNCVDGGIAVRVGLDANRNGVLDADEIAETVYVCHSGANPDPLWFEFEFPSASSKTPKGDVGSISPYLWLSGEYVSEVFEGTDLPAVTRLELTFDMYDYTNDTCPTDLSWDVMVNDTVVGTFGWRSATGHKDITIEESWEFDPVDGAGDDGTTYTIALVATTDICSGGGSYRFYPDGKALLSE